MNFRRLRTLFAGSIAAGLVVTACVDLSSPKDSPASISLLQAGSLFAVQGDIIRDTLGNPAKLNVIAYDGNGNEIGGFTPSFFIVDSLPKAKINSDGTLSGTTLGQARVIGQIGNLQTPALTIFITAVPTTLVRTNTALRDSIIVPASSDSASAIGTLALNAGVRGASNAVVGGVFVRYEITRAPASRPGKTAVYLQDDNNHSFPPGTSTPDTTDGSGNVSRKLVVNSSQLTNPAASDTVFVQVTAKYRGVPLSGSPVRFVVPVKLSFNQ